jgi:DnaD/phage-associated family protein
MKTFSGFTSGKVRSASIPEPAFTELIPLIDDLAELKLTLHVLWRLGQQRGKTRYLRRADLTSDRVLLAGLGDVPTEALSAALERAVERGTLLRAESTIEETSEEIYFANTPRGRAAVEAIARGESADGRHPADELEPAARPNIFTLYEQNIGLLTPLIADELREAEQTYPAEWIEDAFREAVTLNKRSWKYAHAILERWHTEGRGDETDRRDREADRRRYIEGEYGEYIEH